MSISHTSLDIYIRNQRVSHINSPGSLILLDWLGRLDGDNVTKLVLMSPHGWLTIDLLDGELNLCFCDNNLEIQDCEVVSRQAAADQVLQFIQGNAQ